MPSNQDHHLSNNLMFRVLPLTDSSLAILAALLLPTGLISAQTLLSVDYQNTSVGGAPVTQSGFEAFDDSDAGSALYSTVAGDVTVTMTGLDGAIGGHFNRGGVTNGGGLAFADVYNDFAFKNGGAAGSGSPQSMTLTFSGAGISASTSYSLTFFSYDSVSSGGSHTVSFNGASGSSGSAPDLLWTGGSNPTTDGQYATTGTFTSDGSGVLTIDLSDSWTGATDTTGIRLNAFELDVIPEPSSGILLGLGGLAMLMRRRRK